MVKFTLKGISNLTESPAYFQQVNGIYRKDGALAFGGESMRRLYDFLTDWRSDQSKIPYQVKLYPKTFLMLTMINLSIGLFSAAAAKQLILTSFPDDEPELREVFLQVAQVGLTFLGISAIYDFSLSILEKVAFYLGADDTQAVARLARRLDQLINLIGLIKPEELIKSFAELPEGQQQALTGSQQAAALVQGIKNMQVRMPIETQQALKAIWQQKDPEARLLPTVEVSGQQSGAAADSNPATTFFAPLTPRPRGTPSDYTDGSASTHDPEPEMAASKRSA